MENPPIFNTFVQDFLGRYVIDRPYVFIDYWSLIHFVSGSILGVLFAVFYPKRFSWLLALALLVLYEIFEVFLIGILFVSETLVDQCWDLVIGMLGFFVFYYFFRRSKS